MSQNFRTKICARHHQRHAHLQPSSRTAVRPGSTSGNRATSTSPTASTVCGSAGGRAIRDKSSARSFGKAAAISAAGSAAGCTVCTAAATARRQVWQTDRAAARSAASTSLRVKVMLVPEQERICEALESRRGSQRDESAAPPFQITRSCAALTCRRDERQRLSRCPPAALVRDEPPLRCLQTSSRVGVAGAEGVTLLSRCESWLDSTSDPFQRGRAAA